MKTFFISTILCSFLFTAASNAGDIKGKINAKSSKRALNTIIYIEKIEGKTFLPPKEAVIIDQKNLEFLPHIQPILIGTKVKFLNSDNVLHNVFSPDACANKFNLGTWAKGTTKDYTFKEKCITTLLCNVHPEMEAYVLVLETPYFTKSEKDGSYVIKDVPAGTYTLKVWNEKLEAEDVVIKVPAKGDIVQNFNLKS